MSATIAQVRNADRMMIRVRSLSPGIEVEFADGFRGVIPWVKVGQVHDPSDVADIELPNLHMIVLRSRQGETVELPWDFARHYCDASYRPHIEAIGAVGRQAIGQRIRQAREQSGLTQEATAAKAGIGRVTLVRIENGEQSPRYETLVSIASALGRPLQDLLASEESDSE